MVALPTRLSVVFDAALTDDFSEADISAALMELLDSGDHAVALVLPSGVCRYANHAFHSLVGASVDEAGLRPVDGELSVPPALMDRLVGLSTDHPGPVTVRLTDYHGRRWQLSARSVSFPSGQPAISILAWEVTRSVLALQEQTRRASLDSLTGLPHRSEFRERLASALLDAQRRGSTVSVAFLDIDRFKEITDQLGHRAGDQVLAAVAARLVHQMRAGDTLGRIGGDEFGIFCEDVSTQSVRNRIAQRIEAALEAPIATSGMAVKLRISSGVVCARVDESAEDVLARADHDMYAAKRARQHRRSTTTTGVI